MEEKLSIIVLTHNDELRIVDCLENLTFADELIIIDDNSQDRTVELCKQFTRNIYVRSLNSNFSNQRNFALNHAKSKWVLFIDSDELISPDLAKEIKKVIESKEYAGYYLKRYDFMWGKKLKYGEVGSVRFMRLARKESGKWYGKVHETWRVVGRTSELNNSLKHVPHSTVFDFVKDIDEYSSLRSEEQREKGKKASAFQIVAYPTAKFIQNYIFRRGYKDGVAGFVYAMLMSFHSFLVRGKLFLEK